MSDEEEIVGSDFIGSDDEEKSVEALELKLQKILQEKEKLEKQKKKDELLSKIKQAEAALSNLQTSSEPSKSEIDAWTTDEIKQFFRRKGIIVKNKPLDHIRKLAKSVIDSRIPDHTTTAPSEISKRTINKNGTDLTFPDIKDKSLSNWSDDLSSLPSVEHVQAHAYILSSAEFDLDRFQNIQKEDSFLLYKGNAIKKIEVHKLDEGFCYVTCNCMSSQNSQTHLEVVWSLIQNDGCIHATGCSCDVGSDCCKHSIALLLTLSSLNKSNNYAVDQVQRGDEATKINSNRSLTNLKHGKDGLSKEKYLGVEMKESRRNKVYTYQSEESEDEDETTQEVWVPPTIIENKSTITDKINEPPSKQNDRFIPLRKSQNNLAMYRSEPDTLEKGLMDPSRPERQILREKQTEEGTSINQLQSKFEARQTKRTLEVETVGTGKFSEISAYNREMQLNSRIHHNIKEIEKTRKESTEPKPLIPPRSDVLSNLREQSMKRDRQETCGNVPFLRENEQHSNAGNGGMIFNNVPVKSGEVTFSHKPMTNSENLHVNSFNTTPYSSQPYTHTTSSEQTTDHETVTPSLRSHLGFKNMFPLQETDTQQKPISRLGYPMQVKSTAIPTHVSTYPTGQLSKPTDIPTNVSLYPTVQLPKPTALPTHVSTYPTVQLSKPTSIPTDVSLYPTGQLSKPTSAKPTVISTYPTGQLSKPTTIPTDVSKYLTGQLSKPTNISTYPTGQLSKPTTTPTVVSKYPTDQLSKPTSANPTVISTYPTGQLSKPTTTPTDVSTYPTGQLPNPTPRYIYPKRNISSTETQGYTPVYQPTVPISLVYPTSNVLFPAEQSHVNFMSNVAPVPNYTQPQMVMDLQPGLLDPRYSSSDASFPMPLVYPVDETTTVKNKQSVHTRDIIDTNTKVQKTKVSRKDRFMTAATTSDENNESPKFSLADNSVAATKAQRITYDRKVLLRLQKSVFSQRRPDNIDHIPEIQVVSTLDEMPVTYHSFTLTPGYVKRAARETQPTPATDKPAVRSKPKPKRTQSPAAAAPPGAVSAQPQITTEEIMRKAIGAINMVKHGCDASIVVKVISDLPINTEDALSRIVNLVVDTAVDDASCLSVCTSLCRVLARAKVQSRNDPGECVTFSMAYRQKCTKEIEQGILSRSTESHNRRIEEIARFTGSIARLILLKTSDIHAILMKFAQTQSEKCLECFCTLLTEVWERMEKCTSANYLDQYFEVIDEVLLYSETNAALKYKLGQLKSRQR